MNADFQDLKNIFANIPKKQNRDEYLIPYQ
jgi:hypothetical protein